MTGPAPISRWALSPALTHSLIDHTGPTPAFITSPKNPPPRKKPHPYMQIKNILTGKEIPPDMREAPDFVNNYKCTCSVKGSLTKDHFLNSTGSSPNVPSHPSPVWIPEVRMIDTGLGKEVKTKNAPGFKRHSQDSRFPTSQT